MPQVSSKFAEMVARKEQQDKRRYKQKEIAEGIGVSPAAVSRWMKGEDLENSSLKTLTKVCQWLGCQINDLVEIKLEEIRLDKEAI